MKATDLREKDAEDLRELAKTLQRDVFQNRLKNFTNRLDDTSSIRKSKRDYARVVTLLREKEKVARASAHEATATKPETKPAATENVAPKAQSAAATAEDKPETSAKKSPRTAKAAKANKKDEAK